MPSDPVPSSSAPLDVLADAVAHLRAAVERLACSDDPARDRVRRALAVMQLAERGRVHLPSSLGTRFDNVREWVRGDPTLRAQSDRDIVYLSLEIVAAFHEAVRLLALRSAVN